MEQVPWPTLPTCDQSFAEFRGYLETFEVLQTVFDFTLTICRKTNTQAGTDLVFPIELSSLYIPLSFFFF